MLCIDILLVPREGQRFPRYARRFSASPVLSASTCAPPRFTEPLVRYRSLMGSQVSQNKKLCHPPEGELQSLVPREGLEPPT